MGLYPIQTQHELRLKLLRWLRITRVGGHPDAPVLIDQEGGRCSGWGPHWPVYPPGAVFGALYDIDPQLGFKAARLAHG